MVLAPPSLLGNVAFEELFGGPEGLGHKIRTALFIGTRSAPANQTFLALKSSRLCAKSRHPALVGELQILRLAVLCLLLTAGHSLGEEPATAGLYCPCGGDAQGHQRVVFYRC